MADLSSFGRELVDMFDQRIGKPWGTILVYIVYAAILGIGLKVIWDTLLSPSIWLAGWIISGAALKALQHTHFDIIIKYVGLIGKRWFEPLCSQA